VFFLTRFWVSKWLPKILQWHPKFWKPRYGFALYWSKTVRFFCTWLLQQTASMLLADTIFWRRNCKQNCTFRIYTLSCAPLRFGLLRLISTGARLGTIQHAHKKRLFPFEHSLLCVAQCVRSCVKVAWQRNSALTWHKLVVTWCKLSTISVFAEK